MENNLQARRVIYITEQLLAGKKVTVNQLHEHFTRDYPELTKRTLQRDMVLIREIIPALEDKRKGRELEWKIPRNLLSRISSGYLSTSELLSLYFLKAYLKLFKGTVIEEQADLLIQKVEELAPEEIIPHETLFGDKNIGFYDYSDYDPTIRKIIRLIQEKKLADIEYIHPSNNSEHQVQALFQMIFTYSEMLYAIIYVPKYDSHLSLSIQNIIEIRETDTIMKDNIEFDFTEWSNERFGVFWGEPVNVEIEINSEVKHYFEKRKWHSSQKFVQQRNGNLLLKLNVPIVPDFTAWLMSWGDAIKILKPKELIINLKRKYQSALDLYE